MSNDLNIFNTAGIGEDVGTPRPPRFHSGRTADGVDPPTQRQSIAAHSISLSRQDRSVSYSDIYLDNQLKKMHKQKLARRRKEEELLLLQSSTLLMNI